MSDVVEKIARALSVKLTGSDWLLNDHREAAIAALDALAESVSDEMCRAGNQASADCDGGYHERTRVGLRAAILAAKG